MGGVIWISAESSSRVGDLNNDGKVDFADVVAEHEALIQRMSELEQQVLYFNNLRNGGSGEF